MDGSEASPTGGGARRMARRCGQRIAGARWPGHLDTPNSMGFLPTGMEWNDELTEGVLVRRGWPKLGVLLPSSSAMNTGGSGGPLATGTPPTAAVDLGEAPPVIGLARQASVGLGDGGSEGKGSSLVFFLQIIKDHRGCLYRGKHSACYARSLRPIRLRFGPIPQGFLVGFGKG
jgi:hypothetical protein